MNSRGFTLVELVITIALLSMLFSVIATNMVGLQNRQLERNYTNYTDEVANAACVFIDSNYAGGNDLFYTTPSFVSSSAINEGSAEANRERCISNGTCYILSKVLLEMGYLSADLKDPKTNAYVTDEEIVQIKYDNGEKSCSYYAKLEG